MIRVSPHARHRDDRAGDPLDGLVNLFDLGIVLSVAFLLAALSALRLPAVSHGGSPAVTRNQIRIAPGQTLRLLPTPGSRVVGHGSKVGTVYRLPDGRLVYVTKSGSRP